MELDLLCIHTDCPQLWCFGSNRNNLKLTSVEIQGTTLAIALPQSLHPESYKQSTHIKYTLNAYEITKLHLIQKLVYVP